MVRLVLGVAVGYVLGARAGRERYEQIKRLTAKAADNPAVQGLAGFVLAKASAVLPSGRRQAAGAQATASGLSGFGGSRSGTGLGRPRHGATHRDGEGDQRLAQRLDLEADAEPQAPLS